MAPATMPDGTEAVLEIGMPHMEALDEIAAMRFSAGDPTAPLIDADEADTAMLLERCIPGSSLRALPEPEQDLVIVRLLRRLWRKPTGPRPFRPLSAMAKHWIESSLKDADRWPDPGLTREGLRLMEEPHDRRRTTCCSQPTCMPAMCWRRGAARAVACHRPETIHRRSGLRRDAASVQRSGAPEGGSARNGSSICAVARRRSAAGASVDVCAARRGTPRRLDDDERNGPSACAVSASMRRTRVTRVIGTLICAVMMACSGVNADAITSRVTVNTTEYLDSDGAKLFLLVRGSDRRAPVLLWLHGGPGGAERPLFRYFNGELEDHFVVAYWDQRSTGRSFDADADPHLLTVDRHLADLDVVVDHLRHVFAADKIALVGHSWGTALGLLYAQRHPDKVSAFIGVAQVVSTRAGQQVQHEFVLDEATRRHDSAVLEKLQRLGPPPYRSAADVLAAERLADRYGAIFHNPPNQMWVMVRGVLGGLVTPWEIPRFIRGNNVSLEAMNDELLNLDLARTVPSVDVPVIFMLGRYDRHVDAATASAYFEALRAPVKRLVWFENSAHNIPFEEPDLFNAAVVDELRSGG